MKKPSLVVLAAGLGSRYGGLKQIAPVDDAGHILIDFAIYDAMRAGFEKVICIITPELEKDFREVIGNRISKHLDLHYAHQIQSTLPKGFSVPPGRVKPWGTSHAVLSARNLIGENFAVINADDYYGPEAYRQIYRFLTTDADDTHHAMVGYLLENTLTEHGHVARGICKTDANDNLIEIVERTRIEKRAGGAVFIEDGCETFLPAGTTVSMNLWGYGQAVLKEIEMQFSTFLERFLPVDPLKCEYYLPYLSNILLKEGKGEIKVLRTPDKWYGVTYAADMPRVREAVAGFKKDGSYPEHLWEGHTC